MFSALLFRSATKCQDSMYKGHYCHRENLHSGDPGLQLQSAVKTKEEKCSDCKDALFVKRKNVESKSKSSVSYRNPPPPKFLLHSSNDSNWDLIHGPSFSLTAFIEGLLQVFCLLMSQAQELLSITGTVNITKWIL